MLGPKGQVNRSGGFGGDRYHVSWNPLRFIIQISSSTSSSNIIISIIIIIIIIIIISSSISSIIYTANEAQLIIKYTTFDYWKENFD